MEEPYLLVSCQVLALGLHWGLLSAPFSVIDLASAARAAVVALMEVWAVGGVSVG